MCWKSFCSSKICCSVLNWWKMLTNCQVRFWSQHISFWLVGIIIVTSIRGLLITLTKVCFPHHVHCTFILLLKCYSVSSLSLRSSFCITVAVFRKTRVLWKQTQPTEFWGFYWVLGFIEFLYFLFERAVGKLVGWFSSSTKLLLRFVSTSDYLKICKFLTYWLLEAVNIKKSLIITGRFLGITRVSEPCTVVELVVLCFWSWWSVKTALVIFCHVKAACNLLCPCSTLLMITMMSWAKIARLYVCVTVFLCNGKQQVLKYYCVVSCTNYGKYFSSFFAFSFLCHLFSAF